VALHHSTVGHLRFATTAPIGPATAPSYQEILATVWPEGIHRALWALHQAARGGDGSRSHGQRHLLLCKLTQEAAAAAGPVRLIRREPPRVLSADDVIAAMAWSESDSRDETA
jgi:hypothetical protein